MGSSLTLQSGLGYGRAYTECIKLILKKKLAPAHPLAGLITRALVPLTKTQWISMWDPRQALRSTGFGQDTHAILQQLGCRTLGRRKGVLRHDPQKQCDQATRPLRATKEACAQRKNAPGRNRKRAEPALVDSPPPTGLLRSHNAGGRRKNIPRPWSVGISPSAPAYTTGNSLLRFKAFHHTTRVWVSRTAI